MDIAPRCLANFAMYQMIFHLWIFEREWARCYLWPQVGKHNLFNLDIIQVWFNGAVWINRNSCYCRSQLSNTKAEEQVASVKNQSEKKCIMLKCLFQKMLCIIHDASQLPVITLKHTVWLAFSIVWTTHWFDPLVHHAVHFAGSDTKTKRLY